MSSQISKRRPRVQNTRFDALPDGFDFIPVWDPVEDLQPEDSHELSIDEDEVSSMVMAIGGILDKYSLGRPDQNTRRVFGMEVGDDRVDASRDPWALSLNIIVQESVLGMVTSWEDTAISNTIWNFCEISNAVPVAKEESFDYCRKSGDFKNLGFVDSPPLRILLDVSKGDGSHSSTSSGKSAMLGTRMRTPRDEILPSMFLASFLQDGLLRTSKNSDPKYLPRIMGGSGCRALYDNPTNLLLYTFAYKSGRCNRVYGSATRELYNCLTHLSRGQASMPILCRALSDKQEYLHGTFAEKIFIPKASYKDSLRDSLPVPFLEATGGANRFQAYENRLVRTKHLLTRTSAVREWEFTTRIRDELLGFNEITKLHSQVRDARHARRKEFDMALSANTAFANMLERKATLKDVGLMMGNDQFQTVTSGATAFTLYDAQWLVSGGKYEDFSIEDLTVTEDLYLRSEVSEEETFKVGGIPLRPVYSFGPKLTRTTTKVGLYEINSSMSEWADDLISRLRDVREEGKPIPSYMAQREFLRDPEWVNDDSGLIGQCLRDTEDLHMKSARVLLVSADKRLANQMSNTCNVQVERLHPIPFIKWAYDGEVNYRDPDVDLTTIFQSLKMRDRRDPVRKIYLDTGSIAAFAARLEERETEGEKDIFRRTLLKHGVDEHQHRFNRYVLEEIPLASRQLQPTPIRPVLKPRKFSHNVSRPGNFKASRSGRSRSTLDHKAIPSVSSLRSASSFMD